MRDDRLGQLLAVLPREAETRERAARARRGALARMDHKERAARRRRWIPALAVVAMLGIGTVWITMMSRVEPLTLRPPAPVMAQAPLTSPRVERPVRRRVVRRPQQDRLQVQLVLSDGTRVQWIFDKDFSM